MGKRQSVYRFLKRAILLVSACLFIFGPAQAQWGDPDTSEAPATQSPKYRKATPKPTDPADIDRMVTLLLGLGGVAFIASLLVLIYWRKSVKRNTMTLTGDTEERLAQHETTSFTVLEIEDLDLNYQPVSLAQPLRNITAAYQDAAEEKGLIYTSFVSEGLNAKAYCDEKYIRQCLKALIDNAIKFTDQGRVHVHITAEPSPNETLALQIIVADTGRGIDDNTKANLFIPSQTKGLNLLLARSLVRNMGGDLTITTRVGRGTEITLTSSLSLAVKDIVSEDGNTPNPQKAPVLDLMQLAPELHAKPKTNLETVILIVEDISDNQTVLKSLLEPLGYICHSAYNGEKALAHLQDHAVDVILMDVHMPGMDGVETTRAIRSGDTPNRDIPIIAITADTDPLINSECLSAGADLFMTKPIKKTELIDSIAFLLSKPAGETALG